MTWAAERMLLQPGCQQSLQTAVVGHPGWIGYFITDRSPQ
jgi:hypothetical protein